ncbi:muropeptide MFS transporter AmpG, partial [Citrobacter portucalensis]
NESMIPRTEFRRADSLALLTLVVGCCLLRGWLLLLTMNAMDYCNFSFLPELLEVSLVVAVCGVVFGGLLDYLALRKTLLALCCIFMI